LLPWTSVARGLVSGADATGAVVAAEGVQRAYSPEKLARLTAVKNAYDPDNVST
jgi:FAD/FMN-containing dehydrogenase